MVAPGTAVNPLHSISPFRRWLDRQQANDGSALEAQAAIVSLEELLCAIAIAETISPGYFTHAQTFLLRERLFEARDLVNPEDAVEIAGEAPSNPATPFSRWLAEQAVKRSSMPPPVERLTAIDAAAARIVYDTMDAAKAVVREAFKDKDITIDDILKQYDAVLEHAERIQSGATSTNTTQGT